MWEPTLNPDDLLREFVTLVFGPTNAPEILRAYQAIARIRCHSCEGGKNFTGLGTDDAGADARAVEAALAGLEKVKIDPSFRPRIPIDIPPAQFVADLKASLEVMRDYARLRSGALPEFARAVEAKERETAARLQAEIRQKYAQWRYTLAGRQEWTLVERVFNPREASARVE